MKPLEKKPEIIYRIIDRQTGGAAGSYSRACCDEYDFYTPEEARSANCHGMFMDKGKYKIAQYCVTYELINDDVDDAESVPLSHPYETLWNIILQTLKENNSSKKDNP
jgi:hypothetical protein